MEDLQQRKTLLNQQLATLNGQQLVEPSNFKFIALLRSRIIEEGVPPEYAGEIVALVNFDLTAVNEDDDYIGDVALKYSEYCARVYFKLYDAGLHKFIKTGSDFFVKAFNPLGIVKV